MTTRLISLAAHKLLLDVTQDSLQYQRIRSQATTSTTAGAASAALAAPDGAAPTPSRSVLTMEDLAASLKEYGINICRPEYISDVAEDPTVEN
ncbi:Transcription initiation factor TFIID subunit 10 [Phytophthora citrophthora]|uniref:Transcription initiation factor TFIID subunit 10 n=1 Tax=Phytophthora citrophthora TaxID=4793 RepID=A0AAD9GM29_9STRA|nr:Transcription initiation factor TFIID subunit 10 [Phytophthora citrophthora]